jgi:hypothetical protein
MLARTRQGVAQLGGILLAPGVLAAISPITPSRTSCTRARVALAAIYLFGAWPVVAFGPSALDGVKAGTRLRVRPPEALRPSCFMPVPGQGTAFMSPGSGREECLLPTV